MEEWRAITANGIFVFNSFGDLQIWIASQATQIPITVIRCNLITYQVYGIPGGTNWPAKSSIIPTWNEQAITHSKLTRSTT